MILRTCLALFLIAGAARADIAPDPEVWIPYRPAKPTATTTAPAPVPAESAALTLALAAMLALSGVVFLRGATPGFAPPGSTAGR